MLIGQVSMVSDPLWLRLLVTFVIAAIPATATIVVVYRSNKSQRHLHETRLRHEEQQADKAFWVAQRRTVFARMLEAWTSLVATLLELAKQSDLDPDGVDREEDLRRWRERLRDALIASTEAELVGDAKVATSISTLSSDYRDVDVLYQLAPRGEAVSTIRRAIEDRLALSLAELRNACRDELGQPPLPPHSNSSVNVIGRRDQLIGLIGKDGRTDALIVVNARRKLTPFHRLKTDPLPFGPPARWVVMASWASPPPLA